MESAFSSHRKCLGLGNCRKHSKRGKSHVRFGTPTSTRRPPSHPRVSSASRQGPQSSAMDRLESLGNTISQITLYDIKSMYNQVQKTLRFRRIFVEDDAGQKCCAQRQRNGGQSSGGYQRRAMVSSQAIISSHRDLISRKGSKLDLDAGYCPRVCLYTASPCFSSAINVQSLLCRTFNL